MRTRIYIATTEGPALVQRLAPEEGLSEAELSAVCLNGTPTRLPITGAYTYFVRDHVRGLSGGAAYRLDLDRRIDGGSSWMLGAWIAHVLLAEGSLALADEPAEAVVFATGEVAVAAGEERRAEIRGVSRVSEKVVNLAGRAEEEGATGRPLLLLVPRENEAEAKDAFAGLSRSVQQGLTVHGVSGIGDVRRALAIPSRVPPGPEGASGSSSPAPRRRGGRWAAVLLLCLVAAAAGTGYAAWRKAVQGWQALRDQGRYLELARSLDAFPLPVLARGFREGLGRAVAAAPVLSVAVRRPADRGSCAGLRFRGGGTVKEPAQALDGVHRLDGLRTLCGFEVRAAAPEAAAAEGHGWMLLSLDPGRSARPALLPARRLVRGPLDKGPLRLSQDLPLYIEEAPAWTVTAVVSPVASEDVEALLRGGTPEGAVLDLEALGVSVIRARIELAP